MTERPSFARVREIVFRARELTGQERVSYLDTACGGDHALREEVESLLAHDHMSGRVIEAGGADRLIQALARDTETSLSGTIGEYRIERVLGRGGMGVVYEAVQNHPHRRVALKVMRRSPLVGARGTRLFEREVRALARLKHPGIAAIYGAGETLDGAPYYAMELVDGRGLDDHIADRAPPADRKDLVPILETVLAVCDAVSYAHQRGVIHRDLKPSNLMVIEESTEDPSSRRGASVKVLDFGLARLEEGDAGSDATVTRIGEVQGTLAYMSPEQARGDPSAIDIRTDVYSLGVILYELITRRRPHELRNISLPEATRIICEELPTSPRAHAPWLPSDLETIIMTAMAQSPDERYDSVSALAADIERYLQDLPILAASPSTVYQLRKLVRRHRTAFAWLVVLVVLLVGFSATVAFMYREQLRINEDLARSARVRWQVVGFFTDVFTRASEGRRLEETSLAEGLREAHVRALEEPLDGDTRVETLMALGRAMWEIGDIHRAKETFQAAAVTILDGLSDGHPEHAQKLAELRAIVMDPASRGDEDAPPRAEALLQIDGEDVERARVPLANAMLEVAQCFNRFEDATATTIIAREAQAMARAAGQRSQEAIVWYMQAISRARNGDLAGAERECRAALRFVEQNGLDYPLDGHMFLGQFLLAQEKNQDAIEPFQTFIRKQRDNRGGNFATARRDLGTALARLGRFEEADSCFDEAARFYATRLKADQVAHFVLLCRSEAELMRGRVDEAVRLAREAIDVERSMDQPRWTMLCDMLLVLGEALMFTGDVEGAEAAFREALNRGIEGYGDADHIDLAQTRFLMGWAHLQRGHPREAEAELRKSIQLWNRSHAHLDDWWWRGLAEMLLGVALEHQGRLDEGRSLVETGLQASRGARPPYDALVRATANRELSVLSPLRN